MRPAALLPLLTLTLGAQSWDAVTTRGFDHFYNVEYEEAIADFDAALKADPQDPARHNHLAQAILYNLMLRVGALESEFVNGNNPFLRRARMEPTPAEQRRFLDSIATAIRLSEARMSQNPRDAGALYAAGVAYGLRANYDWLVRKSWLDALRDVTTGRKLHNRVVELEPARYDARLLQGVHDYVVGSLPWGYKILGFLAGFHGDRAAGARTLKLVAEKGEHSRVDAEVLLAALYRRERNPTAAIPLINDLLTRFPRNYILLFELSQMHADAGDKQAALAALTRIDKLKATGAPGYRRLAPEKVLYARGNLLFWYRDWQQAIDNLLPVTAKAADLDPNTASYAWLRLGQCRDVLGQRDAALAAYRQANSHWPESDAGKEARNYLRSPYRRAQR